MNKSNLINWNKRKVPKKDTDMIIVMRNCQA